MSKVITFGEIMLRLSSVGYDRLFQNDGMQATFGGGEANVAVSLANFGIDSTYVTKLPEHAVGQAAVNALRYFGVDTEKIVRGGDRVGIYYLEKGISQRPSASIRQLQRHRHPISIGTLYLKMPIGFILRALPPRSVIILSRYALKP